jgi:hypothetical protein
VVKLFFKYIYIGTFACPFFGQVENFCPQKNANGGSKIRKLLLLLLLQLLGHRDSNKVIVIKCLKVEIKKKL